ncbi:MAG: alpha/beta hydrolase [Lentilactobacillus diolivorans]|uniref:alpha/beta fold hydrolase n=1 Tax=Lentilactobacillus diolivorans TaxID=179838 RepID=UPI0039EA57FF
MKFTTSDHVALDYNDQGEGPTILLLSGIGGYKEVFEPIISPLLSHHFRVINVDARNQGASEHTIRGRRMSRHAIDIKELLDSLAIDKVIGIGNSMGAATLFAYISLFGDDRFLAIIDIDQSPKMISDETWQFGFKSLDWSSFPDYLKFPFGKAAVHKINDDVFADMKAAAKKYPYNPEINYPLLVDHAFQDWRDIILELNRPLLIVAGEQSPYFDPNFAATTAKIAKRASAKIIANAGHLVMAEQPVDFLKLALKFLKQNHLPPAR